MGLVIAVSVSIAIATATSAAITAVAFRGVAAVHQRAGLTDVVRLTGEDALELSQRPPDTHASGGDAQLADRHLVLCAALLYDRQRPADLAAVLEVAQKGDGIREIAHVDRRIDLRPDEP